MLAAGPAPRTAAAQDVLRVLSLDVSAAPAIQARRPVPAEKPSWRTSFGSERETKDTPKGPLPGLDADVVLLQGITSLPAVQRAFPGRAWKLVVSKQMVLTDDPVDPRTYEAISNAPATAIAVRYQSGLRVAGQEHFLARAGQSAAAPEPGREENPGTIKAEPLVAGTAVRLNIGGRFLWVASTQFATICAGPANPCPQRDSLDAWRKTKLDAGAAVMTGGLRQTTPAAETAPLCAEQSVTVSPARKDAKPRRETAFPREGLGCIAVATAGGQSEVTPAAPQTVPPDDGVTSP